MNIGFAIFLGLVSLTVILRLREIVGFLRDPAKRNLIGERFFFILGLCPWLIVGFIHGGTEAEQLLQGLVLLAVSICFFSVATLFWFVRRQQKDSPQTEEMADEWPSPDNRMP